MSIGLKSGWMLAIEQLNDKIESGGIETPTVDTLEGATDVGKSVMKAATAADARAAIGAGTSNLTVGTGATNAKAGNYQPTVAQVEGLQAIITDLTTRIEALENPPEG